MVDYDLDDYNPPYLGFSDHPRDPDISLQLNNIYGFNIEEAQWKTFFNNTAANSDPPFSTCTVKN